MDFLDFSSSESADSGSWHEKIKSHLGTPGNVVQVTTPLRSTIYEHKHREMFSKGSDGHLRVQSGKKSVSLGPDHGPWVGIRMGSFK